MLLNMIVRKLYVVSLATGGGRERTLRRVGHARWSHVPRAANLQRWTTQDVILSKTLEELNALASSYGQAEINPSPSSRLTACRERGHIAHLRHACATLFARLETVRDMVANFSVRPARPPAPSRTPLLTLCARTTRVPAGRIPLYGCR